MTDAKISDNSVVQVQRGRGVVLGYDLGGNVPSGCANLYLVFKQLAFKIEIYDNYLMMAYCAQHRMRRFDLITVTRVTWI